MNKIDRLVKFIREEGGMTTGSTAGKPGFSNAADAEGPTAGRDELLFGKIVRRRKKNKSCEQGKYGRWITAAIKQKKGCGK